MRHAVSGRALREEARCPVAGVELYHRNGCYLA